MPNDCASSRAGRSETFCAYAERIVAELHQQIRNLLDERRRAADERPRPFARRPRHLLEERTVDAAVLTPPLGWRRACGGILDTNIPRRAPGRPPPPG